MKIVLTTLIISISILGHCQAFFSGTDSIKVRSIIKAYPVIEDQVNKSHRPQWNEMQAHYENVILLLKKKFPELSFSVQDDLIVVFYNGFTIPLSIRFDYTYRKAGAYKPVERKYVKVIKGTDFPNVFNDHYALDPITFIPLDPPPPNF